MWQAMVRKLLRFLGDEEGEGVTPLSPHLEQAASFFETHRLCDLLPYEAYDEAYQLFMNRQSMGFILECTALCGADEKVADDLQTLVQEICPEGSYVQCLLWADPFIAAPLKVWREERRRSGSDVLYALTQKRCHFYERLSILGETTPPRRFRFMLTFSLPRTEEEAVDREKCQTLKTAFLKLLQQHTRVVPWSAQTFVETLYDLLFMRPGITSHHQEWDPYTLLNEQFVAPGYRHVVQKNGVLCNDTRQFISLSVTKYPKAWSLASMGKLLGDVLNDQARIHVPFFIHYGLVIPPQEKEQGDFFKRILVVEHQGRSQNLLKVVPGLKEEVQDYGFAREQLHQGKRLLKTHMGVGLFTPPAHREEHLQLVKSLFRTNGWALAENTYTHFQHFLGALPFMWSEGWVDEFKRKGLSLKTSLSQEFSCITPLQGEWQGTHTPGMLLMGRKGQVFHWHAFDNDSGNYNTVVVGRSGSGKSVFMQELLVSTLGMGGRVFVIDVGRSFEKTCKLLEGQFIEFTATAPLCLNPFSRIPLEDTAAQEDTFSMLKPIFSLMAAPTTPASDLEMSFIEAAIKGAWATKKQQATVTDVATWLTLQEDPTAKRLAVMLGAYAKGGTHSRYFEGENNVDFTNPMVVVELEELKEKKDLQSVVLQMFIMTITNQMFLGDRKTPFHICIDEAWDLLRGAQTGLFIETLARRLRKYNGSLVIGTQSVNDFYQTPGALAAFENSDWMCLLAQKKESIEALKESKRLSLDPQMETALKSVSTRHGLYSEVMIYNSSYGYAIGRLLLDPFSGLLYSTKAEEYTKVQALLKEGLSMTAALEQLVEGRGYAQREQEKSNEKREEAL